MKPLHPQSSLQPKYLGYLNKKETPMKSTTHSPRLVLLGLFVLGLALFPTGLRAEGEAPPPSLAPAPTPNLEIRGASVTYLKNLDLLVFEQKVRGKAGATTPEARGAIHGAPVLGYVFPTTLKPADIGFGAGTGTVALAVTAHPDFDDTPLWDENNDRRYDNDGGIFHSHWVVLVADSSVPGGLAVEKLPENAPEGALPPTNPGMPMLMDSPGFSIVLQGDSLKVLVPAQRVGHETDFKFDAVTAYMEVSTASGSPSLGVHRTYTVLSGDLSLPYSVRKK